MDIAFQSATLAALCNSERLLADRWGIDVGRSVGRRLLEIGAADVRDLQRLPRAVMSADDRGETIIDFGDEIVVRGVLTSDGRNPERILITSLEVQGSIQQ